MKSGSHVSGTAEPPWSSHASWVNDFIEECVQFPNGALNDQIDAMTQALLRWHEVPTEPTIAYYSAPVRISAY